MIEYEKDFVDVKLDDIYQVLIERADGEEDMEAMEYDEYLLSSLEEIRRYIHFLEHMVQNYKRIYMEEHNIG